MQQITQLLSRKQARPYVGCNHSYIFANTCCFIPFFLCKVCSCSYSLWLCPVDSVLFFFFFTISDRTSVQCSNWPQIALVQLVFPWWQGSTCWVLPQYVQQADGFGVRITSPLLQQPFAFYTQTQTCAPSNFEFQDNCLISASLISDQS